MRKLIGVLAALWLGFNIAASLAQTAGGKAPVRAKNPKFPPSVTELFNSDARESLTGTRPDLSASAPVAIPVNPTTNPGTGTPTPPPMAGAFAWSKVTSADALQNEIKAFKTIVAEEVRTPPLFKSSGSKRARRIFTEYAAIFAVIAEYDGEVRWKNQAVAARDAFARCAGNCKVATDGSYDETKKRIEDLETLVGGGNLPAGDGEAKNNWPKIADRRQIMGRMEELQKQLQEFTASEADFKKNADKVGHLAQILAVLSAVSNKPGYEYADDKDFGKFIDDLLKSCADATAGAADKNYETVRKAIGEGTKSCANCHSSYRS